MAFHRLRTLCFTELCPSFAQMNAHRLCHRTVVPIRLFGSSTKLNSKKSEKLEESRQRLLKSYPDPKAPVRPPSSFLRFAMDYRANHQMPHLSRSTMGAVSNQISIAWRELPPSDKAVYEKRYESERQNYQQQKRKYEESNQSELWLEKIMKLSQVKPPNSGYKLFLKVTCPELKRDNPTLKPSLVLSVS